MTAPSPGFATVSAFTTPILFVGVPDAAAVNAELARAVLTREREQPSLSHSTQGGWQSTHDVDTWAGPCAASLLTIAREVANRATVERSSRPVSVPWRTNIWANIDRNGHGNELHSHPGSFWSGIYYVDDGGVSADPSLGGELEFMDPRAPGAIMYARELAILVPGGQPVGANQLITPKAGQMVMFPAWLLHQVRRYRGTSQRIPIAFNLSL
jgi:uncharacterized protein (TIGR02466 family)